MALARTRLTASAKQVTPFRLDTPDGANLYAWHVLPLPTYLKHEASLVAAAPGPSSGPSSGPSGLGPPESLRILREDAEARLVLYCGCAAGDAGLWC